MNMSKIIVTVIFVSVHKWRKYNIEIPANIHIHENRSSYKLIFLFES